MPFEGEPPNGDYAGYIDRVINRGTGTPGEQRLLKSGSGGVRAKIGIPGMQKGTLGPGEQYSSGTGMPSALVAPIPIADHMPAGLSEPASTTTLAAQRSDTAQGLIQTALGGLFALASIGSLISAIVANDELSPFKIIQIVILFIIARHLLKKGLSKVRSSGQMVLKNFPPLVSKNSAGKTGHNN